MIRGLVSDRHAQAIAWVAVFLPALLIVLGLVLDGGLAFTTRRDLQNLADGAARAGAMQVDQVAYTTNGTLQLDPGQAQTAAQVYLSAHPDVAARVTVGPTWVTVTVTESQPTVFLKLFGISAVTMSAHATANARIGQ